MINLAIGNSLGTHDAADTSASQAWLDPATARQWVVAQLAAQEIVMMAA
jgi:hypothetical protein